MATEVSAPPKSDGRVNFNTAVQLSGLTPQYLRRLTVDGKIPDVIKNEKGAWRYDANSVKEWAANRTPRARGLQDGRQAYKVRLNAEEFDLVSKALKPSGITLQPAYKRPAKPAEIAAA